MNQFLLGTDFDIVALVRAENDAHATERVDEALRLRGLKGLSSIPTRFERARVQCFASDLSQVELGLREHVYRHLAGRAAVIVHVRGLGTVPSSIDTMLTSHALVCMVC